MPIIDTPTSHIYYAEIIPESKRASSSVLIFLHEALGSVAQFKYFPQLLCNELGLKGIVYEREGYGNSKLIVESDSIFSSPRKSDYLERYALDELPLVIDELVDEDQQVILVGHSDGGSIALLYAKRFPSKVKSVITMAAHVINEEITRAGIHPAIDAYKEGKLKGLTKYHGEKTEELFYAWANTWLSEAYKHWNITSQITPQIKPGLIIQGVNDQYGSEKQVDLIHESFTQSNVQKCILEDCGHAPHLEQQTEVINKIRSFLNA